MEDIEQRVAALELRVMELQRGWMDTTESLEKHHEVFFQLMTLPAMSKNLAKALVEALS